MRLIAFFLIGITFAQSLLSLNLSDQCDSANECCFDVRGNGLTVQIKDLSFINLSSLVDIQAKISEVSEFVSELNDVETQLEALQKSP